jgi:hypothetical protein
VSMIDSFPYSADHNPAYCDRCSDEGFVETPYWRAAWDRAAAVFADTGDHVAAAFAFRGLAPDGSPLPPGPSPVAS